MPGEADELGASGLARCHPPGYHYGWLDTVAEAEQGW